MNRKGQHETMKALVGLALVAVIFLLILKFITGYINSMSTQNPTERSFDGLVQEIKERIVDRNPSISRDYILTMQDTIGKDYWIIAFDHDNSTYKDSRKIFRPSPCKDKACLCLYEDDPREIEYQDARRESRFNAGNFKGDTEKDNDKGLIKCQQFPGKVYFSSFGKTDDFSYIPMDKRKDSTVENAFRKYNIEEDRYTYFGISGDLALWKDLKTVLLYIEKVEIGDSVYILLLIDDRDSSDDIDTRELLIREKVEKYILKTEYQDKIDEYAENNEHMKLFSICQNFSKELPSYTLPEKCRTIMPCTKTSADCDLDKQKITKTCVCLAQGQDMLCRPDEYKYCADNGCTNIHPHASICSPNET